MLSKKLKFFSQSHLNIMLIFLIVLSLDFRSIKPKSIFLKQNLNKNKTHNLLTEGCTIGVASAKATTDGRPLLWKIRDNDEQPDNKVFYNISCKHKFVSVINKDDTEAWMGVNEKGFAIINSTARDLPGGETGFDNGELMRYALGECYTVIDFENLLKETDTIGRRTQANFGIIDSLGNAVMYEVGGKSHWKFDAADSIQAPDGYLIRSNFAVNGGGDEGIERFNRADRVISDFSFGDSLSYKNILKHFMRDFSDFDSNPAEIPFNDYWISGRPFGYIYTNKSICRKKSVSASVIHGIKSGESPTLSTMWTMLGQPAASIALPYWPVGATPEPANGDSTAKLCDISNQIKTLLFDYSTNDKYIDSYKLRDNFGDGLWESTFFAEDSIINQTEILMTRWREQLPEFEEMLQVEDRFCNYAFSKLETGKEDLINSMILKIANTVPFKDENGIPLTDGKLVELIWAGKNESIDDPITNIGSFLNGRPTGDDSVLYRWNITSDKSEVPGKIDTFICAYSNMEAGMPARNDMIYLRVFNHHDLKYASYYGDTQLYKVGIFQEENYDPVLSNGLTDQNLDLKLSSFNSQIMVNYIQVNWETQYPGNNVEFFLDKSISHINSFKKITSILLFDRTKIENQHFSYEDYNVKNNIDYYYRIGIVSINNDTSFSGTIRILPENLDVVSEFYLYQNYPNPFNSFTKIKFQLPGNRMWYTYHLTIFNCLGEIVKNLGNGKIESGKHTVEWDGKDEKGLQVASGLYFINLTIDGHVFTKKILLLK